MGLLRDLSSIDSTGQEYATSNVQLESTTVINLYRSLEPDCPLLVLHFSIKCI